MHGILPTNHRLHRHEPSRRGCPACSHRDEQWTHILRCPHQSRADWRTGVIAVLKATCDKLHTRPKLRDLLLDGISGWFASPDPDTYQLQQSGYADEFKRLISQQNKIGWKHVFLGRFSMEWSNLQDIYYTTRPDSQQSRKGSTWQVAIINCLWDQWSALWDSRNKDVHGVDARQSASIARQNALRTLRELYDLRDQVEPSARELLMKDIRDHAARSTWHLKTWITINESTLRASYQRAKRLAISGMRSLRSYWSGTS